MMNTIEQILAIKKVQLDDDQLRAVNCMGNTVVGAGAGSGKTTVLSYRFLKLMLSGMDCDRILALTFTQKAAKEMQSRIASLLAGLIVQEGVNDETKAFLGDQFANHFPLATISTLDSFCSTIVRNDAIRYGLTADFSIDEDRNSQNAKFLARQMLNQCASDEGARILSQLYNPSSLSDLLSSLAIKDYYLPHTLDPQLFQNVVSSLASMLEQKKRRLLELLGEYAQYEPSKGVIEGSVSTIARTNIDQLSSGGDELWKRFVLAPGTIWRKPGNVSSEFSLYIKKTTDEYKELRSGILCGLLALENQKSLGKVIDFLCRFHDAFQKSKRETGLLCFNDVSNLAVDILKENVSLRSAFASRFDAIMIDEFQDNNQLQRDLLFLLSAKDTYTKQEVPPVSEIEQDKLFFVGDEKQSIFRFRGADVSIFKSLSNDFAQDGTIELNTNYRTESFLIELFSTMFSQIMGNASSSFEATFKTLKAYNATGPSSFTLLVKPYEKETVVEGSEEEEDASNAEAEAYAVASKMNSMLTEGTCLVLEKDGTSRPPKPSDIALLLRSGGKQLSYEKALKKFGIPYSISQVSRSLMLESPANDLYAMLQLCVYPSDRIAYEAALRSPFCNFDDALVATVLKNPIPFMRESSPDMQYQKACDFFEQLQENVRKLTLPSLVQFLWYESGYRLALMRYPRFQVYLEHYEYLYRLAMIQQEKGNSLVQFLDEIRPALGTNTKLEDGQGEVITEGKQGVQIMSIHKAKGLEFPIVFVADLASKSKNEVISSCLVNGEHIPNFMDENGIRNVNLLFDARDEEKQQSIAEMKRLLYVALTRAKSHLVLSLCLGKKPKKESSVQRMSDWVLDSLSVDRDTLVSPHPEVTIEKIQDVRQEELNSSRDLSRTSLDTLDSWYGAPLAIMDDSPGRMAVTALIKEVKDSTAPSLPSLPSDAIFEKREGDEKEEAIADFGTLVHALVMQDMDKSIPSLKGEQLVPQTLKDELSSAELETILSDGEALSSQFLSSAFYQKEVKPFKVKTEVHFFSREECHEGGKARMVAAEGSIDVLVDKEDHFDLLDFKTDKWRDPASHRQQLLVYARAAQRITGKPVRSAIVFLRDCRDIVWNKE
ncbi:MAG: UvrD-helicase domain-containing protein [Sphaerochaetaceae bacterium]